MKRFRRTLIHKPGSVNPFYKRFLMLRAKTGSRLPFRGASV